MAAPALRSPRPHSRLQQLALTRGGSLFGPVLNSQPGSPPRVWVTIAPALLQYAGRGLSHPGLAPGVQASWNTAIAGTAHPTAGQALAFAVTLLPAGLLRLGALYLAMRLARAAARDGVHWPASWGVSWPVEWLGLGLIIFARVMRAGAAMHADLEGTV